MIPTIIILILLIPVVLISIYFLYTKNTRKIESEIKEDINTMKKSLTKNAKAKKMNIKHLQVIDKQIFLLRNNIEKFNNRFFLGKKRIQNKTIYSKGLKDIELLIVKIQII